MYNIVIFKNIKGKKMIPYNDRIKFPQLVIQKDKYADSHYLANSLEDLLNIGWHIFKQWVENNYFDYLEGSSQPDVDLFNQEKAETFPWVYSPYSKLDTYKFYIEIVDILEKGEKSQVLEQTFKNRPDLVEKMSDIKFWKIKALTVIRDTHGEYMEVETKSFNKF